MMGGQRWGDKWAGTMVIWNKYAFSRSLLRPMDDSVGPAAMT